MTTVDLFAGAGGFSTGAEMAGARVVWAANHWPLAVEYHAINHPSVQHVCQDLHQADWSLVPRHDLMLVARQQH
ncbi:DNA cytosine methyltransferase [Acetobacter sp.]|uniref:DNA cytosine methyltransferase n=1 Tax=Acetobacter sp. TaxID=440 RepID=UPI0039EB2209